jgi:hypothetical protein
MTPQSTPAMSPSHQVVELKRGKHSSPAQGACVVELASMLAGERFSDRPRSVCPVIASYMRTLNDRLDEASRQQLYPYAAAIVGTRGPGKLGTRRARLCLEWAEAMGVVISPFRWLALRWGGGHDNGRLCARAALRHGGPSLALALADGLIAAGAPAEPFGPPHGALAGAADPR